jgi:hypothetical protein
MKEKEYEELRQCTFKPKLNHVLIDKRYKIQEIPGVEGFIQKVIKTKEIQQQKQAIE